MRRLTEEEAIVGARVLYAGPPSAIDVSPSYASTGQILETGHPGVITAIHGPGKWHVVVEFVGLEDQSISLGTGFDSSAGEYPGLAAPTDAEWKLALKAGWWAQ